MDKRIPPVAIVGAGIAGLVAARELRRQNIPVAVFEAGKQVAGLAKSFRDDDGFTYDFGAHFITNRLAAAAGISSLCQNVPRYTETIHRSGKNCGYPFGLLRKPRFLWPLVRHVLTVRNRCGFYRPGSGESTQKLSTKIVARDPWLVVRSRI